MRTVGALLVVCLAFTMTPLASASSPVEDVVDGPCPGLVPTIKCAVDPVVHEVKRDVGIAGELVWDVGEPVCRAAYDIVTGTPSCPVKPAVSLDILDRITA